MADSGGTAPAVPELRAHRVLRVREGECEVGVDGGVVAVPFAPMFPSPRLERVSPGHLVAVASGCDRRAVVVWRWYDAVVLGSEPDGDVLLWEPAHGQVKARLRRGWETVEPGLRVYASAGLPGAEWWAAGPVGGGTPEVDLAEVRETMHG